MRLFFRVAPGVRLTASRRGLSAGLGPRIGRVHVGTRGVGVSTGVGPISAYEHLSGGGRRGSTPRRRASYGPTKAQIAAHQREVEQAEREADIERVRALESALTEVHTQSFPEAARPEVPPPEAVDPGPIEERLVQEAGIPELVAELGDGESPPVAADPEPVDRYRLMREHRRRERQGIPFYAIRRRIAAAKRADEMAERAAAEEAERRLECRRREQERLDSLWLRLQEARASVAARLPREVEAEEDRRERERAERQAALDEAWEKLQANDPAVTLARLEEAFADNESPAAPIDCEGDAVSVVMQFPHPEELIPERKPARTPTGKPTLKKRTKTEINELYVQSLASNVLATAKEAFAVAPGTDVVQMLAVRRRPGGATGELDAIYVGEFRRGDQGPVPAAELADALRSAPDAALKLKGRAGEVVPLDLDERPDLKAVLDRISNDLSKSRAEPQE